MIDWRKPKHRRIGEKDGPFHWHRAFDYLCYAVFILVGLYGAFESGRYYETRGVAELREEIATLRTARVMSKNGPNYLHFVHRGQSYYVINPKDEGNPKKWIKSK